MRWLALLVGVLCGGCDVVFGLDEPNAPCALSSFANAKQTEITLADEFSLSWDLSLLVYSTSVESFEQKLPGGTATQIDLGLYTNTGFGLDPEGNALFYTTSTEPPVLHAAVRGAPGEWRDDPDVPVGSFAGTPSADAFGPRRVLVRMRPDQDAVQEYEDDSGRWKPVGDIQMVHGGVAPNLTPNGLTMVYATQLDDGTQAIVGATRASTADWFGAPVVLLPGAARSPQLLDRCSQLYVVETSDTMTAAGALNRYAR